jgi:RNA polymerase sigma factor (sigma-70 family)
MAHSQPSTVLDFIRTQVADPAAGGLPDRELLSRFATSRDEGAFVILLRRHGPLVWRACQRVLQRTADAEDVFQATFLVLARRAGGVKSPDAVGPWLYGVAHRLARETRRRASRQQARDARSRPGAARDPLAEVSGRELVAILEEELAGLPERYRSPLLLCSVEGKSTEEAARQLGCSPRTTQRRLQRARELLHRGLGRCGFTLSGAALCALLVESPGSAALPAALAASTVQAALPAAAGQPLAPGLVSAQVAALVRGAVSTTLLARVKVSVLVLVSALALGVGTGIYLRETFGGTSPAREAAIRPPAQEAAAKLAKDGKASLEVVVKPKKSPFTAEETPAFLFTYTNRSEKAFKLFGVDYVPIDLLIEDQVTGDTWKRSALLPLRRRGPPRTVELAPGKAVTLEVRLEGRLVGQGKRRPQDRDRLLPGQYRLTAELRFSPDERPGRKGPYLVGRVASAPVAFAISEPTARDWEVIAKVSTNPAKVHLPLKPPHFYRDPAIQEKKGFVFRTAAELRAGYSQDMSAAEAEKVAAAALKVPGIDWKRNMLLAPAGGTTPAGWVHELTIVSVRAQGKVLTVAFDVVKTGTPARGGSSPMALVLVPKFDGEVRFVKVMPEKARKIPLAEVHATPGQPGAKQLGAEVDPQDLAQVHGESGARSPTVFLVAGKDIAAAVEGSRGRGAPAKPNEPAPDVRTGLGGKLWLGAYLGGAGSMPAQYLVQAVEVRGTTVQVSFTTHAVGKVSSDLHDYLIWAPLGEAKAGAFTLELYEGAENKKLILKRKCRVIVDNEPDPELVNKVKAAVEQLGGRYDRPHHVNLHRGTDADLVKLPAIPYPFSLHLGPKMTEAGLKELRRFPTLVGLNLIGRNWQGKGWKDLECLDNLRELTIEHAPNLGDIDWRPLCRLTALSLNQTQITGLGLKQLPNLCKLSITNSRLSDAGMKDLRHLKGLTVLSLEAVEITDAGLLELKACKNLVELNLEATRVTGAGVRKLGEALPNCKVRLRD